MRTFIMHIVTYLIEYLGKFEFIFKTSLDYESGDQMGSFEAKNRHRKSHAWAPLMQGIHASCSCSMDMDIQHGQGRAAWTVPDHDGGRRK
jgi:hypothetical protein